MDRFYWKEKLQAYRTGDLPESELPALWGALADESNEEDWVGVLAELSAIRYGDDDYRPAEWETIIVQILEQGRTTEGITLVRPIRLRRIAVAAAIIGLIGIGLWWMARPKPVTPAPAQVAANDVAPPTNSRAWITLANGQTVAVDSIGTVALHDQDGARIVRQQKGIVYQATVQHPSAVLYNTLVNPRGSPVVTLTLADGTKVWLNSESSIRYPILFTGADRTVEITGEAYLEVTKDASKPFQVTAGGTTVDVLGTSFNINTYTDEPMSRVTLIEGKVNVIKGNHLILLPGQQAEVEERVTLASSPQPDQVLAWKNGHFAFRDADLPTVMRQLARYYDVTVHYEGDIPKHQFNGKLGNDLSLDQILHVLSQNHIHYTIAPGRHLTIRP